MTLPKTKQVELTDTDQFLIQTMLKNAMNTAMDQRDLYAMRMCCDLWEKIS